MAASLTRECSLHPAGSIDSVLEANERMPDIRFSRPGGDRLWWWVGGLAVLGLVLWASAFVLGDATQSQGRAVGANANFGEVRAPLIPAEAEPFEAIPTLETRDLGRLVRLSGVAASGTRSNAIWVRTPGGRRILVRFEPPPPAEQIARFHPGSNVQLDGYLSKISNAEFRVWMDTLGVSIPRPPPGNKFGDLPDPAFARVDSLFIKNFYISVRPEALLPTGGTE